MKSDDAFNIVTKDSRCGIILLLAFIVVWFPDRLGYWGIGIGESSLTFVVRLLLEVGNE